MKLTLLDQVGIQVTVLDGGVALFVASIGLAFDLVHEHLNLAVEQCHFVAHVV